MSTEVDIMKSMIARVCAACVGLAVVVCPIDTMAEEEPGDPVGDAELVGDDSWPWFQGTTEEERQRAREVFLEGNQLIAIPAYARAAEKYQEAIEIWDNPAFHYNLAIAQINLLQPTEAYGSLKQAVRHGPEPLGDDKHQQALEYMASLEAQLARVRITCDQPQVLVLLDGKPLFVGPGNYVGFVQPGGHQLVARKEGYNTDSRELVASPGEELAIDLRLTKPDQVLTVRKWAAWKPWAVVAGGVVLLGGAAYFDVQSSRGFDDFDADFSMRCPTGCPDSQVPDVVPRLEEAELQQKISLTTYAIGGAVLATGAILLYINRERIVRLAGDSDAKSISLIPTVSHQAALVDVHLRF